MKKIILFFCLLLFACAPSESDLRKKDGLYYKKNEDLPFSGTITIDYTHQAIFEDGNYKIVLTDDYANDLFEDKTRFEDLRNYKDAKLEEFDFKKVHHTSLFKKDDGLYYIPDFDLPFQGEAIIRSWKKESHNWDDPEAVNQYGNKENYKGTAQYVGTYVEGKIISEKFSPIKVVLELPPTRKYVKSGFNPFPQVDVFGSIPVKGIERIFIETDNFKYGSVIWGKNIDDFEEVTLTNAHGMKAFKFEIDLSVNAKIILDFNRNSEGKKVKSRGKKSFNSIEEFLEKEPNITLKNSTFYIGSEIQYGYSGNPDIDFDSSGRVKVDYGSFKVFSTPYYVGSHKISLKYRDILFGSYIRDFSFCPSDYASCIQNKKISELYLRQGKWQKKRIYNNGKISIIEEWIYDRGKLISNRKL